MAAEFVTVTLRLESPQGPVHIMRLLDDGKPSTTLTNGFTALLRRRGEGATFEVVLYGNLVEVCDHLHRAELIPLRIDMEGEEPCHLSLPLAELLPEELNQGHSSYRETQTFDDGDATLTATLELTGSANGPTPDVGFTLRTRVLTRPGEVGLRLGGVECGAEAGTAEFALVGASSWQTAAHVMEATELTVVDSAQEHEAVLDDLVDALRCASESAQTVVRQVGAGPIALEVQVALVDLRPRPPQPEADPMPSGPRTWRLSVNLQSVKLTNRAGSICLKYHYDILKQSRPFRTHPSVAVRKNSVTHIPNAFCSYTLDVNVAEAAEELEQQPLPVEVWHRDSLKGDEAVGTAFVPMGDLLRSPSRGAGRCLDKHVPILAPTSTGEPTARGLVHVVVFLEDLGPARGGRPGPAPLTLTQAPAAVSAPQGGSGLPAHGGNVRETQPYSVAFELEMWKRAEESKFKSHLREIELTKMAALEEDFQDKERKRQAEFAHQQQQLLALEKKLRMKFSDLEARERALAASERTLARLTEETNIQASRQASEASEVARRAQRDAEHRIQMEREKAESSMKRVENLEKELAERDRQVADLRSRLEEATRPEHFQKAANLQVQLELRTAELNDARDRAAVLGKSRDYFKKCFRDACARNKAQPGRGDTTASAVAEISECLRDLQGQLAPEEPQQWFSNEAAEERRRLLASGLYGEHDRVILALQAQAQGLTA
mmetsp:Transcript_47176/g.106890  ORF Transcript_47176/g.106890 Transcript_47176/m.106890 type:complete len:721 (-) Transcript_47176:103-2265(-)